MKTRIHRSWKLASTATILGAVWLAASVALAQPQHTVVYNFNGTDGFGPMAGVIQGQDGALYGTTSQGGLGSSGTIFRFDRATKGLTTLHDFNGTDGSLLYSGLVQSSDGTLYGSTFAGGDNDQGTLFQVSAKGTGFLTLHLFGGADGAKPNDSQLVKGVDADGNELYFGATSEGGANGGGTLFQFDPITNAITTLYDFPEATGVDAGIIAGPGNTLYGTTYTGGANGQGSVFQFDPDTCALTTLHDFAGTDGANPVPGSLMLASNGVLFGTTQLGGNGTVYKLDLTTQALTTLHTFSGLTDGRFPLGGLTEAVDGYLYGTTVLGGQGYGTIFRVHPTLPNSYSIVVRFGGSNGRSPSGNLVSASDGSLYGVTRLGGADNAGTVYRLAIDAPPTILSITASPSVLKPANGKMIPVTVTVNATDDFDSAPVSRIIDVTCNQPAAGDWQITGDLTASLRAKTRGKTARVYTLVVQCTDSRGNSSIGKVNVSVSK